MRTQDLFLIGLFFLLLTAPALAKSTSYMVDRPGQLLDLAEQLTTNIMEAEKVRDECLRKIKQRSAKLEQLNAKLQNPRLTKAQKLELEAYKNRLEREETAYRREALGVVKDQMDNVFGSLDKMRTKLEDLQGQELAVDPQTVEAFNRYFQVSAQLIRNSTEGMEGVDPGTLAMLETLEKSLIVSRRSTYFLAKASEQIKEYQKIVVLYNAQLVYLAQSLEKYSNVLDNERDAITITVSLETASKFMEDLNVEEMEDAILSNFSREPRDFMTDDDLDRHRQRIVNWNEAQETLKRFEGGYTLKDDGGTP